MKTVKNRMYLVLFALALIITTSCNKDDDGGDDNNNVATAGTVKAKIDGTDFTSNTQTTNASIGSSGGASSLSIFGSDFAGKTIQFSINNGYNGVGTYPIGGGANISVIATYMETSGTNVKTWQAPFDGTVAGEVNISESSTKVVGTFNFTAQSTEDNTTKVISEGSFNINLQ